jgi:hypothetical protein
MIDREAFVRKVNSAVANEEAWAVLPVWADAERDDDNWWFAECLSWCAANRKFPHGAEDEWWWWPHWNDRDQPGWSNVIPTAFLKYLPSIPQLSGNANSPGGAFAYLAQIWATLRSEGWNDQVG